MLACRNTDVGVARNNYFGQEMGVCDHVLIKWKQHSINNPLLQSSIDVFADQSFQQLKIPLNSTCLSDNSTVFQYTTDIGFSCVLLCSTNGIAITLNSQPVKLIR